MDFDQVAAHFNKPIKLAARDLGTCTTNLKKVCRSLGILRWPYRKIRSLDAKIEVLQKGGHGPHNQSDLQEIKKKKELILNGSYEHRSPKEPKTKKRRHDSDSSEESDDSYDPKRAAVEFRSGPAYRPSSHSFPGEITFQLQTTPITQSTSAPTVPASAPFIPNTPSETSASASAFVPTSAFCVNAPVPHQIYLTTGTIPSPVPQNVFPFPPASLPQGALPLEDDFLLPYMPVADNQSILFDENLLTQLASQC